MIKVTIFRIISLHETVYERQSESALRFLVVAVVNESPSCCI